MCIKATISHLMIFHLNRLLCSSHFLIPHEAVLRGIINEIEETLEMLCHIEGCIFSPENVIPSYSRDMIVSLILHLKKTQSSALNSQNDYINNVLEYLLLILPPEVAIRARESRNNFSCSQRQYNFSLTCHTNCHI
jgi:hypothetical protein